MILLLDLDDTLLGNRMDSFIPAYLQSLAARMVPYVDSGTLIKSLLSATRMMVENTRPDRTLEETFDGSFFPALNLHREDAQASFDTFYREDFPKLRPLTEYRPEAVELVEGAIAQGYHLAIATNPLFPRTAILQRLSWAGLPVENYPFTLVPSYDTFHFAKPNPAYYAEFLGHLGWPEEPLLMVGDDVDNDIVPASQAGIPVFWIAEDTAHWNANGDAPSHGGLKDVLPWIREAAPGKLQPDYSTPSAMAAILRATPAALASLCAARQPADLALRPEPKEWGPTEVLCHLRDVDNEVNLPRLCKVLDGNNPFLPGKDTDPWAEERHYHLQDGLEALAEFTRVRMMVLEVLDALQPQDWQRQARHAIFGPTRLHELVNIIAGHDRLHIQQIHRALTANSLTVAIRSSGD